MDLSITGKIYSNINNTVLLKKINPFLKLFFLHSRDEDINSILTYLNLGMFLFYLHFLEFFHTSTFCDMIRSIPINI